MCTYRKSYRDPCFIHWADVPGDGVGVDLKTRPFAGQYWKGMARKATGAMQERFGPHPAVTRD